MEQINLNSNIVNGIYSVVGVLMVILLTHFIQVIVSCHNLHTIYDVRKPLRLNATRLSLFMDPGLGPRRLSRLLALLAILVTALITAGGFAFVGATEPVYQTVYVRNKVVPATRGNYVDFRKHVSTDGQLFSTTFHLLYSADCVDSVSGNDTWYVRTNDLANLTDVIWPVDYPISNSTCIWDADNFQREILNITEYGPPVYETKECFSFLKSEIVRQEKLTHIDVEAHNGTCPYHDLEIRCSNYSDLRCVGSMRVQDDFGGFSHFHSRIREGSFDQFIPPMRMHERDDAQILESMAFITNFLPSVTWDVVRNIAASRVEENGSVQKRVGEQNVTRVNIGLFTGAFVSALALLVGFGTIAFVTWVRVVWLKGRRGYNSFSMNEDALACAAQALHWGTDGGSERAGKGVVVRGVDRMCVTRNGR